MALPEKPITRKETYLAKAAGQSVDLPEYPITREEAYLDEIAKNGGGGGYILPTATASRLGGVKIGSGINVEADGTISASGGGSGTSDYTDLTNKPQINGVTLSGNKTEDDLGLGYTEISYEDWHELTPQEQETGKWDVTGVPGGGGGGSQKAYGTAVNILTATQQSPYTCPSDGVVNIQSGYVSSNYTALYKVGWNGFMAIAKGNESQANGAMTVPVLKGDVLYVTTSGTGTIANYYPYVDAT